MLKRMNRYPKILKMYCSFFPKESNMRRGDRYWLGEHRRSLYHYYRIPIMSNYDRLIYWENYDLLKMAKPSGYHLKKILQNLNDTEKSAWRS